MKQRTVRAADHADLDELTAVAEEAQTDPERFVAYIGEDRLAIASEITGVDGWVSDAYVAERDGRIVGWILAETDLELHRVWWWGPVIATGEPWGATADVLYAAARAALDGRFDQEELAADARSTAFAAFAERHRFAAETASTILRIDLGQTAPDPRVSELLAADREQVAALHDALFPGTHTTGRQLVDAADGLRRVIRDGTVVVGYVAAEIEPGGDGYIDFLGVEPDHRGNGTGGALVSTVLDAFATNGVTAVNLTVRQGNAAARRLYRRLGFDELRDITPFRKGFTLP